jgi:hypothetical protein
MTHHERLNAMKAVSIPSIPQAMSLVAMGVALGVMALAGRSHAEVVVTEFPRDGKPQHGQAIRKDELRSTVRTKAERSSRITASKYLRDLRQVAKKKATRRMSLATKGRTASFDAGDEVKLDFIPLIKRNERAELGYGRLRVPEGTYGVEGHGTAGQMFCRNGQVLTAIELARWIRNDPRHVEGMPVYLLVCETGKGRRPLAQRLADILHADVFAPTERLWIHRDGTYSVYSNASENPADGTPRIGDGAKADRPGHMRAFHPSQSGAR